MECKNKGDSGSGRSKNGSDLFGHAGDPHNMEKSMPCLSEDSASISSELYEFLQSSIPNIVGGCQRVLLYSVNRFFYSCLNDLLALGGGGNFSLCLDGDLLTRTSGPCETFGNLCLAHD